MTTNWKRTEAADGAGAMALRAASCVRTLPARRLVRSLRWRQDAVCGYASADEEPDAMSDVPVGFPGFKLNQNIFFHPAFKLNRKPERKPKHNPEKKGKQASQQVTISQETRNLA